MMARQQQLSELSEYNRQSDLEKIASTVISQGKTDISGPQGMLHSEPSVKGINSQAP